FALPVLGDRLHRQRRLMVRRGKEIRRPAVVPFQLLRVVEQRVLPVDLLLRHRPREQRAAHGVEVILAMDHGLSSSSSSSSGGRCFASSSGSGSPSCQCGGRDGGGTASSAGFSGGAFGGAGGPIGSGFFGVSMVFVPFRRSAGIMTGFPVG